MGQRGVDGTSMRDLAAATGLNVATLYHYFPSKREILVAVLEEHGFVAELAAPDPAALDQGGATSLGDLLAEVMEAMLAVEDFIRLMLGEVMRGQDTALAVGTELYVATRKSLERWLAEREPAACGPDGAPALARLLVAMMVGVFFEHVAGVMDDDADTAAAFRRRGEEAARLLGATVRDRSD